MPLPMLTILFLFISFLSIILPSTSSKTTCLPHNYICNQLNIRHPFWIDGLLQNQSSNCRSTGFNVTCHENKPLININGDDFIIRDIFYKNNSFLLAKSNVFDAGIRCPTPQRNFTVDGTPFSYGPATSDLFFFYNCTSPYYRETYAVDCASNASSHSFAVFHVELLQHWNYSIASCRWGPVNAPIEDDGLDKLLRMNYTTILKKGFVLQWQLGTNNCSSTNCSGSGLNLGLKIGIGIGAAAVGAFVMFIVFMVYHRRYKKRYASSSLVVSHIGSSSSTSSSCLTKDLEKAGVRIFEYSELEEATDNFNPKRELGDGGYGAVYKAKLPDGRVVAVKKLYENHYRRVEQFTNEVEILTRLKHQNLVTLYGCTSRYSRELLLVYEYIPNGTLADHLHGPRSNLSWNNRLNIAIETASALAYLHASDVIHRDIKSTNILLDNNFTAKVADFGLSRLFPADVTHVSTGPQGTPGYVDPEYNEYYQLTEKSDVYSFGVVLIELISSKPAIDITRKRHEINLSTMAINKIQNNELDELVDSEVGFGTDKKVTNMMIAVAELGFQCLQSGRDMRPNMHHVLNCLEEIKNKDYSIIDDVFMDIIPPP
ncbi:hypothetical protein ACP275_04G140300 [Erythranthe tilingii]